MNTPDHPAQEVVEPAPSISLKDTLAKLRADANAKSPIEAEFSENFLELVALKNDGISVSQILKYLKKWVPKLHHSAYKAMFNAELKRRREQGETIDCEPYERARNPNNKSTSVACDTVEGSTQIERGQPSGTETIPHRRDEVRL